jgi:hypothetical protein
MVRHGVVGVARENCSRRSRRVYSIAAIAAGGDASEPEPGAHVRDTSANSPFLIFTSVQKFQVMEQHLVAPDFDLKSFLNSVLSIDATQVLHSIFSFFTACFVASVRIPHSSTKQH